MIIVYDGNRFDLIDNHMFKNKNWLIPLLLSFVLIALFHGQLVGFILKFALEKSADRAGYTLAYSDSRSSSGALTLIHPVLTDNRDCCLLESAAIEIRYGFDFSTGKIILESAWTKPVVRLGENHFETLSALKSRIASEESSLPIQGALRITEGTLEIAAENGPMRFSGSVEHTWGDKTQGTYLLTSPAAESVLKIDFDGTALQIHADKAQGPVLSALAAPFLSALPSIEVTKGTLSGDLTAKLVDGLPESIEGALSLKNGQILDRNSQNQAAFDELKLSSSSKGGLADMELIKGSLTLHSHPHSSKLQDLKAHLTLDQNLHFLLSSEGFLNASRENSYFFLRASGDLPDLKSAALHIALHHNDPSRSHSSIDIKGSGLTEASSKVHLELKNVRDREFLFAETVLNSTFPAYNPIEFSTGTVSGQFDLELTNGILNSLNAQSLHAEHLFVQIKPWEIGGGAEKIIGSCRFKCSPEGDIIDLSSNLKIDQGELELIGIESDLWHFTDIDTQLVITDSVVQKSSAQVRLGKLAGHAEILEGQGPLFLKLDLNGVGQDLKPFLPERLQKGLEQTLLDDKVALTADVAKTASGIRFKGELAILSAKGFDSPPIHFGFDISRLAPFLLDFPSYMDRKEKFFKALNEPVLNQFTPASFYPLLNNEHLFLMQETGYSSFTLKNGWISADGIQMDKFISPFLFPENEMHLSGIADIRADFDLSGINTRYRAHQVSLQNNALSIDVENIGTEEDQYPAFNRFDFLTGRLFGSLPLSDATYIDKDSGLLFTGINAVAVFEGQKVHIDQVEAFSSGVYFAGNIDVDYSSPEKGVFDVSVQIDEMDGLFSEMQHLYSHFDNEAIVTRIPLESKIALGPRKALLAFHVFPEDFTLVARVECLVQDGEMQAHQANLLVRELCGTFYYDHLNHLLDFKDLQAILLHGGQEYGLIANDLTFERLDQGLSHFDIHIKEGVESLLRLKGGSDEQQGMNRIYLDPETSHFCKIHPEKGSMLISDWNRVESIDLSLSFRLSSLLHEIQRFKEAGIYTLSPEMIQEMNQLSSASGDFTFSMDYKGDHGRLNFDLEGRDVELDQYHFKNFRLNGYNRDKRWLIEQLEMDAISIAAELMKNDDEWKVDFLGIRMGEGLLIGLDGLYTHGDPQIRAHINLLEADLAKMTEWMAQYPVFESLQPHGTIRGTGELTLEKTKERGWIVDAIVDGSFKDLSWKELALKDGEHVSCHFRSDKGVSLRNLKTAFTKKDLPGEGIQIDLKKAQYDFATQSATIDEMLFKIEASHLPVIAEELHKTYPHKIDREAVDWISNLKKTTALTGSVQGEILPGSSTIELKLADGVYNLWDDLRTISHFTLNLEDDEIRVSTQYLLNQEYIWIAFRLTPDQLEQGEIILADTVTTGEEEPPLIIHWKKSDETGLIIDKINGSLSGMKLDLTENPSQPSSRDAFRLTGKIDFNGTRARKIFPELERSALETLLIGNGYTVQGNFEVSKEVNGQKERDVRFFGTLAGTEAELKGYQFRTLHAQVLLEPSSFQMLDFTLSDPAGTLHIGNIRGTKEEGGLWKLSIPLAAAYDFRPSALREAGSTVQPKRKPLTVRQLFVQDISGTLGDANSIKGYGNLYFDNPQKKGIQNTIFAVPAEILTRIGLNLSVLTPISGTIHYEIHEGKIYLTKFKDVYSDRKISKFYLATSGEPSTIDFDGNLDIQVRFKQSTLLLKLVEMFMINVQGTLEKPSYSLQRQKYLMKEDLYVSTKENETHAP